MKKERMHRIALLALAALLVALWAGSAACADKIAAPSGPSLYERVGGVNNIAVLIDDVIERSYVDEVFKANPQIEEAHKRYPKAAYKYNATALACMVMGGPQKYTGRSLKDAHQHLQVTETEWRKLIKIFRESMNSFKVPMKEQNEILGIIESTKGDVVVSPAKSAANR
ncbi:MAG TPA: group 1 truncated hemoglobin [Geobacteraceae bacterium]|nr:group 1 truncated hemoglobin [Geobacteraceae bacterium]